MTPVLLALGVNPSLAVGTDLLFASVTKGFGTALHGMKQSVSWSIVGRLAAGSIPASLATLGVIHRYLDPTLLGPMIRLTLGMALVLTSAAILLQPVFRRVFRRGQSPSTYPKSGTGDAEQEQMLLRERQCEERKDSAALTVAVGALLGALVTITSVGAGAVGVMILLALYPQVRSVRIVGTDIAHAVPLTLVAGVGHATMGSVDFGLLGTLLLGSLPGIAVGTHLAFRVPEKRLKQGLAVLLLGVGGKMVLAFS